MSATAAALASHC